MKNKNHPKLLFAKFDLLLEQFKELLKVHYKSIQPTLSQRELDEASRNYFRWVTKDCTNSGEKYGAVLGWCEKADDNKYQAVKNAFLGLHKKNFKELIQKSQDRRNKLNQDLENERQALQKQQAFEMSHLAIQTKNQETAFISFRDMAKKVVQLNFSESLPHAQFQEAAKKVKALGQSLIVAEVAPILELPPYNPMITSSQSIQERNCTETLRELNAGLEKYKKSLKNENLVYKFFMLFSVTRWSRKTALNSYNESVACHINILDKYAAAEKWCTKYGKDLDLDSRFRKDCIVGFRKNNFQDYFDRYTGADQKLTKAVDEHRGSLAHSTLTHQQNLSRLGQNLKMIHEQAKKLHTGLIAFKHATSKLIDSAFGFLNNNVNEIVASIRVVKAASMTDEEERLEAAQKIVRDLTALQRHPERDVLVKLNLKERFKFIAKDTKASSVVYDYLDKLLNDVDQYGGRVNNPNYMGTKAVEYIVQEIGTFSQMIQFNKIRTAVKERTKATNSELYKRTAENCAQVLTQQLESGELEKLLQKWLPIYEKYVEKGLTPTEGDKNTTFQQIVRCMADAKQFHRAGKNQLESLVDRIMQTNYRISLLNLAGRSKLKPCDLLDSKFVGLFIKIFGSKQQQQTWDHSIYPSIIRVQTKKYSTDSTVPRLVRGY